MFTKQIRRISLVALVALSLMLLTVGAGLAQDTTVNVTLGMSEFKFDPAALDVPLNSIVTFNVSNTGEFPHNVTFVAPDGTETNLFEQNLAAGQSATGTFTFNAAGEWRMYCPVGQHEERGMVGTLRVAAAADSGQAAPAAAASGGAATAASPSTLPRTGGDNTAVVGIVGGAMLLAVVLLFAGFRLQRTH